MKAIIVLFVSFLCLGQGAPKTLIPHFNCKKIAFYKTHKAGSTTLGGVLFRVAVSSNLSLYTTRGSHYISLGFKENTARLGASDLVLHHIRHTDTPTFHAATRAFYGRALGTAAYGFLTVLRQPMDRYISDFYYYAEPDARRAGRAVTLRQYAAEGEGANRMAGEFSVRTVTEALQFVAGEMQADGLFLPLELLDYGLVLLAAHCGWRLSQVLYLPANSNTAGVERFGNVTLAARPTLAQLAEEDRPLLDRIAAINAVDAVLYGAAVGQLLARLQQGAGVGSGRGAAAGASPSALMSAAVRLMAARNRLEAECRALHHPAAASGDTVARRRRLHTDSMIAPNISLGDLAGLCAWYSMPDSMYERMPSPETGRVLPDDVLTSPRPGSSLHEASWRVGDLVRAADAHFASYDSDTSLPYYHSLLAVRVRPPMGAEAELVYGYGGGDDERMLTAAVWLWATHHAREGLHHLVFFIDAQSDPTAVGLVRQTAEAATAAAMGHDADAGGGNEEAPYTTVSVLRCATAAAMNASDDAASSSSACDSTEFQDLVSRARWSAALSGLTYFMYGTRGSVRSVLMSYESTLPAAGAVCAPLAPWRTVPRGVQMSWLGGGAGVGGGARVRRRGSGSRGDSDGTQASEVETDEQDEMQDGGADGESNSDARRSALGWAAGAAGTGTDTGTGRKGEATQLQGREGKSGVPTQRDPWVTWDEAVEEMSGASHRRRRRRQQTHEDPHRDSAVPHRQLQEPETAGAAASSGAGGGGPEGPLCLRSACGLSFKDSLRCVMVRAMPLLGRTRPYMSHGEALPVGRSSYRVWYRGPEQQRLEVARLMAPSSTDQQLAAEAVEAGTAFRCARVPRPRLRVPWCS